MLLHVNRSGRELLKCMQPSNLGFWGQWADIAQGFEAPCLRAGLICRDRLPVHGYGLLEMFLDAAVVVLHSCHMFVRYALQPFI